MASMNLGAVLTVICILGSMIDVSEGGCPFGSMHKPRKPSNQSCNGISNTTWCNSTTKYRTYDGSCNNLEHPSWGANDTRYQRLLPPKYGDGISSPRLAKSGNNLPSARELTLKVFIDVSVNSTIATHSTMTFGQFVAHDMSNVKTPPPSQAINCCDSANESNEKCFPILVPEDDPAYSSSNITCLNFVRTTTDKNMNCSGKWNVAEQLCRKTARIELYVDFITHIDLSVVYGNDNETNAELRAYSNGLLIYEERNDQHWLPANAASACFQYNDNDTCYLAGDVRVNQNLPLTSQHLIFFREHNRIATILAALNPHWNDEKVFQESRRINIAQFQAIVYNHWLPIILGNETVQRKNITYPDATAHIDDYNNTINAGVLAEHAHAAYRFFHSTIQGWLDLDIENRTTISSVRLSDWFFNPTLLELGDGADNLLRGLCTEPQHDADRYFTREVTWFFARRRNQTLGTDLRAIDVQRDRDHGLPALNNFRKHLGLQEATDFSDFADVMSSENIALLESLYETTDDVDLTVGGSLETISTGMAGPTFLGILSEQFWRTRVGDRFFFENSESSGFTVDQLNQIRKVSMARLICDNSRNISYIQPDVFRMISEKRLKCSFPKQIKNT